MKKIAIKDLPLGGRFKYTPGSKSEYVLIDRSGTGRCAQANPPSAMLQGIYQITEMGDNALEFIVWTKED